MPPKGFKTVTDFNEIRECTECHEKKNITQFVKGIGDLYRYKCKACKNSNRRTGKIRETRFKPGHDKGVRFQKGHVPWYKERGLPAPSKGKGTSQSRNSAKYAEWRKIVLEKAGNSCQICGSNYFLAAHHIRKWSENPDLRFDPANGMALCGPCHGREEGFQKGKTPWNKEH